MIRSLLILPALLALALATGCGNDQAPPPRPVRAKPLILTGSYPVAYFAERIAGDTARVVCPLPAGADPIFWRPSRDEILTFQQADLVVLNGARFEKWAETTTLAETRLVRSASGLRGEWMRYEDAVTHRHGKAGEHAHEGVDGHTWTDPVNARRQAEAIHAALVDLLPEKEDALRNGLDGLTRDLDALHRDFEALGDLPEGTSLFASHPAYNYIARRYGWRIVNLDLDPAEMPADEVFAAVKARLVHSPARHLLWEAPPLPAIADRFRTDLGLESIEFSPSEMPDPAAGDHLAVMRANLDRLRAAFTR